MNRLRRALALVTSLALVATLSSGAGASPESSNGVTPPTVWTSTQTYDWYTTVEAQTERSTGQPVTQTYSFVIKANVAKLTVVNDGVKELDVAVNGRRFNLNAFFDQGKGTQSFDISSLVQYGTNSLEIQSLAKPGASASIKVEAPALSARILHINDIHAKIDPLPKAAAYVKAARAQGGNVYFINAGDIFSGNPVSDLNKGKPMIEALNAATTDLMAVGNHDFDHGPDNTQARREESSFPWLSANTVVADQSATPIKPFEPYKVYETALGQKIAFIALTQTPPATGAKNIVGLQFNDPVAAVQQHIDALRDQVNVIVVVSHQGHDVDTAMAAQISGADLILGAHSHTYLKQPEVVNSIPIIQVGADAKWLSNLVVRQAEAVTVAPGAANNAHTVEIAKLTESDAEVQAIVDKWNALQGEMLNTVIGHTPTQLNRDDRYTMDVSIGNLITDAFRHYFGADVGLTNNGGIRASIPAGDITWKQVYTVAPFGNIPLLINVTGAELRQTITYSYDRRNQVDLQTSGLTYTVFTKPDGSVDFLDMKVNGAPLEDDKTYTVATTDYIGTSGTYFRADIPVADITSDTDAIVVGEFIKQLGAVSYTATEGRIKVKNSPTPIAVSKVNFYSSSSLLATDENGALAPLTNQATVLVSAESTAFQKDQSTSAPKNFVKIDAGSPIPLAAMQQVGDGKVVGLGAIMVSNGYRTSYQNAQWFTNLLDYLSGNKGGTVLFDEGHGQYYNASRFSTIAGFLGDRGYAVKFTGAATPLTAAKLVGVNVLVITTPGKVGAYTADELVVLNTWVQGGGKIVLASQADFGGNANPTELNSIAAGIGTVIRFNSDEVNDTTSRDGSSSFSPVTDEFNASFPQLLQAR